MDATEKARLLAQLEAANRVSAGMLMPNGSTATIEERARADMASCG
jgi:hypothetical protein